MTLTASEMRNRIVDLIGPSIRDGGFEALANAETACLILAAEAHCHLCKVTPDEFRVKNAACAANHAIGDSIIDSISERN